MVENRLKLSLQTEVRLTQTELQDEVNETKKSIKKQLSDGEYDWFLAQQRLKKEVEADKEAANEDYKKEKANSNSTVLRFLN